MRYNMDRILSRMIIIISKLNNIWIIIVMVMVMKGILMVIVNGHEAGDNRFW